MADAITRTLTVYLTNQAVDYSVAEDKAFLAKDREAEFIAHGGMEATIKVLALVMGVDVATATETVLLAQPTD